ncbi:MAG: winged helix-turn-helix transcriptional regulator [Desulfurococcaceae archaeon]
MKKTLQHRVLEYLKNNPGMSLKDLASIMEININSLKTIVYKLKSMGYIEKAGKGFILTQQGEKFLEYLNKITNMEQQATVLGSRITREESVMSINESIIQKEIETEQKTTIKHEKPSVKPQSNEDTRSLLENIVNKINELEKRLNQLELQFKNLEKALNLQQKKIEQVSIHPPVMSYNEALTKYGSLIEKMISENKLFKIGSLVVDFAFYTSFKSKFPIKIADIDKLDQYEKLLLEEMRREALVVLHAGREYKLIE